MPRRIQQRCKNLSEFQRNLNARLGTSTFRLTFNFGFSAGETLARSPPQQNRLPSNVKTSRRQTSTTRCVSNHRRRFSRESVVLWVRNNREMSEFHSHNLFFQEYASRFHERCHRIPTYVTESRTDACASSRMPTTLRNYRAARSLESFAEDFSNAGFHCSS